ncbi:thiamine diphosphokinase [Devosia sp. YIM 151766]|uniref:thiamine diphosphokinase n=1 Tax=Devosia sp. YIM 151766 TaxID=3017325 RepID=UPI00255C2BD0|nr:thiamine diphosphokinase [Devosia sp. YIM 151766]WIY52295.1 thiamine diphosphokinase [Devosia sp. YIM 151766]
MQSPIPNPGETPPLSFDRPMAIVGGGHVEPALLRELAARHVALVAADGGADSIDAAGLVPVAIIGDLDSLADRANWENRSRVIHIPEQITTDFQKALYSTRAPLTLALGMTGKRLDHTLAALSALHEVAPRRRVILVDEVDMALAVCGPLAFAAAAGERISIHPLAPIGFTRSEGLLYPLDGLVLDPVGRLGTSNAGTGGPVKIVPADATPWLLILGRERLWDLMAEWG